MFLRMVTKGEVESCRYLIMEGYSRCDGYGSSWLGASGGCAAAATGQVLPDVQ